MLPTDDEAVLAVIRDYPGSGTSHGDRPEPVLCIFPFAHNPVAVTIEFDGWYGAPLIDLFGGGDFPHITDDGRLTLTLGTQGFYWLHIGDATR